MATTTSARAASTKPVKDGVGTHVVMCTYTLSANPTAADVIQMVPVPKGARISAVRLASADLDTNGTPTITMKVGDGGDDDRFITSSTIGQTGGVANLNAQTGLGYEYTADDTVDITFGVASATFAAGDITLVVEYTTDDAA